MKLNRGKEISSMRESERNCTNIGVFKFRRRHLDQKDVPIEITMKMMVIRVKSFDEKRLLLNNTFVNYHFACISFKLWCFRAK